MTTDTLDIRETNTMSIRVLQNKKKLTYSDIDNIFIVSIQARQTWSLVNLQYISKAIWKAYKDKLEINHTIVLRETLKKLYLLFNELLGTLNTTWIENHKLLDLYKKEIQSTILNPNQRKHLIEQHKDEYILLMSKEK
ncbi:MAG: hypothetical protein RR929_04410 [Erysipelotrichaceae bacterium]